MTYALHSYSSFQSSPINLMLETNQQSNEAELLQAGYRYGWSLTSSKQDAEDLVHDAWIRLIKRYEAVPSRNLLFTTIRHLYIDQLRREKRIFQHQEESRLSITFNDAEPEPDYIRREEMQLHLSKLRDVENEALFLSVVEGYTAEEIADLTRSTRGSVLSLLHRSKQKLRQLLTDEERPIGNVVKLVTGSAKNGST